MPPYCVSTSFVGSRSQFSLVRPGPGRRLDVRHWRAVGVCDRDFHFVAGVFFYPDGEDRAFGRILAAKFRFAGPLIPAGQLIGAIHRRDRK